MLIIPLLSPNMNLNTSAVTVTGSIQLITINPLIGFSNVNFFTKNIASRNPNENWITRHPIVYNWIISLQDVTATTLASAARDFVGLDNFKAIFSDVTFRKSVLHTFEIGRAHV